MSLTATLSQTFVASGISLQGTTTFEATGGLPAQDEDLAAGKTGTLTTRTNDTQGIITLTAGHALGDGEKTVDLFWELPTPGYRNGVTATISTNSATITGGAGDNLPTGTTPAMVMCVAQSLDVDFDSSKVVVIGLKSSKRSLVDFLESGGTSVLSNPIELEANVLQVIIGNTLFSSEQIASMVISNGEATAGRFQMTGLYNSDT